MITKGLAWSPTVQVAGCGVIKFHARVIAKAVIWRAQHKCS
jgi:hypothetical protein